MREEGAGALVVSAREEGVEALVVRERRGCSGVSC